MPSDYSVVGSATPANSTTRQRTGSCRGSPPALPPDCLLPFKNVDRFGGSTREVPLNPRSLYDERRNTVSMQTVLNYCDESTKRNPSSSTPQNHANNHASSKPRLSSESAREIDRDKIPKRVRETNPIATLPRHSAAVNAIGNEERRNSLLNAKSSSNSTGAQSVLELDILPS